VWGYTGAMVKKKLKIAVLFGGKSAEHEVSIVSAGKVVDALDKNKYSVTKYKIPQNGKFNFNELKKYDVVVPILHGLFGEDGTVQGLLKLIDVPFVGASVLGSAVGMDKDVMKRLLRDAGIPVAKFVAFKKNNVPSFKELEKKLGLPMFVKPANAGSSVGITKVKSEKDFDKAIKNAFAYDLKVIVEEAVAGREIECGVIGNDEALVSLPGELIPKEEFYTYKAKYDDASGTEYKVPAELSKELVERVQGTVRKAYTALACDGMGRVDCFLKSNGEVLVNEINTIPGPVMFRRMWEASGVPFPKLLDMLISLALDRFSQEQKLKSTF
jgi:D-alanine-D-alanine ligase